jgi:hypothetical protein
MSDVEIVIGCIDQPTTNPNVNTLMCTNITKFGKCNKKTCLYAHTIEKLTPRLCKYDHNCRISKCMFIHSKETKSDYCSRLEIVIPEPCDKPVKSKKKPVPVVIRTTHDRLFEDLQIARRINNHKTFTIIIQDSDTENDTENDEEET